eukprot:403340860
MQALGSQRKSLSYLQGEDDKNDNNRNSHYTPQRRSGDQFELLSGSNNFQYSNEMKTVQNSQNGRLSRKSKVNYQKLLHTQHHFQIIEYEKKIFEAESRYELEKRKHDQLIKEVQRLFMETKELEHGVGALERENLDFLNYMNNIMMAKTKIFIQ